MFSSQKSWNRNYQGGNASVIALCSTLFGVGMLALFVYLFMPTLAVDFIGIYFAIFVAAAIPIVLIFLVGPVVPLVVYGIALVATVTVMFLSTAPIIHHESYLKLLGDQKTMTEFQDVLPPLDYKQAPFVSQAMAKQAMQKKLSEMGALASQVELSKLVKQLVNDELVWVGFLEHNGFFKWNKDRATPGYVVVSAHNPSDVKLVTELKGKPLAMRYLTSAYFGDDVRRHLYYSGFASTGMADFLPEIDDSGRPFYVATLYENTVGFSGENTVGAVTVDVQTGEIQRYTLANLPAWVDRVQPEGFIKTQMADRGEYINGWLNPSDEGRLAVSDDLDLVYGADKKAYWIGGMTSKGRNNGVTGFYLIDSRTKAVRWFTVGAISQASAESAVEGVVREKKYDATNPLPFLVEGVPTYMMALQDSEGIARGFGLVDMRSNSQVIAVGDTLSSALRAYLTKHSTDKVSADVPGAAKAAMLKGTVVRIASEFRNNQTTYYLTLNVGGTVSGSIFTGSSDLTEELVLTKPGDKVTISFRDNDTRVKGISEFKNNDIPAAVETDHVKM